MVWAAPLSRVSLHTRLSAVWYREGDAWSYQSAFNLTVKVNAPKKRTFSSLLPSRASANCQPSDDFCSVWSVSWILAISAGDPGRYSLRIS